MQFTPTPKKGFSLLEILVVMSIVGVLLTMGVVAFTQVQRRARDAARRADIQAMAAAMEQRATDDPVSGYSGACADLDNTTYNLTIPRNSSDQFIDPQGNPYWCGDAYADAFCLSAELEMDGVGNCNGCGGGFVEGGTHFCLRQRL